MNATVFVHIVAASWLVPCGMMLFSRFLFQAAGPVWMRAFLDSWKHSRTHRVWGTLALIYAIVLIIAVVWLWRDLEWGERALALVLGVVLGADGLLNLLPSWFGHFKERMQDAWVKRHRDPERASDARLFAIVNFFLGFASASVAVLIWWYRPLPLAWLGAVAAIALVLMAVLIAACRVERRAP